MSGLIIALGRSDSHALLAPHACALGISYRGIEGYEVSDHLRNVAAGKESELSHWITELERQGPVFLAVVDSSISSAILRSFAADLEGRGRFPFSIRTGFEVLGKVETSAVNSPAERLLLLSIARSPHGQVALWPVISISRAGQIINLAETKVADPLENVSLDQAIDRAMKEVAEISLVGLLNYVIDPEDGHALRREFGLATLTFWSESASYTSVSEQMIRSILDLPLGDTRMIDFEEYFLQEEIELNPDLIKDPIRPFLHLFARNPRLKVRYLAGDGVKVEERPRAVISLFASTEGEALSEMAHARDFMLGIDE